MPTARSLAADHLDITITRMDTSDSTHARVALPSPPPAPPWILDVDSNGWGAAPIVAEVDASSSTLLARGTGTPVADKIDVFLADVTATDMGPPDFLPPPDLNSTCAQMFAAVAQADVEIDNLSAANFGSGPTLKASASPVSEVLVRFSLTGLDPAAVLVDAKLKLSYAGAANSCGPSCGSCAASDAASNLSVYLATSAWTEAEANWYNAKIGTLWGGAGASGVADRGGSPIGTASRAALADATIDVTPAARTGAFDNWRQGDALSFLVAASSGTFVISSWEGAADTCGPQGGAKPAAQLVVTYCR
jgi:hypothetical protein